MDNSPSINTLPPVVRRFLRYVKIDTQSNPDSETVPSTEKQKNLGRLLVEELLNIGLHDSRMDDYGYVLATLPGTTSGEEQSGSVVVALVAHMDTAPDESGLNVNPVVHPPYEGNVISLPGDSSIEIDPKRQPNLLQHTGERLITSDGTTLLGSDDKAGIAILMQLANDLFNDPTPRPDVRICFTIDEEIGRGVDYLSLRELGANVAYTLDGSGVDTISSETFNASAAYVTVKGRSVHPGYAKDVMVNAVRILADMIASLPQDEAPETTEDRQGYYHPHTISAGDVTSASAHIILRDFSQAGLDERKRVMQSLVAEVILKNPEAEISLEIKDQYKNMRSYIEASDIRTITFAFAAAAEMGFELKEEIVRGGTDGARLSEMGLPTPNIFNGGYDYHSLFEWNTVENLERSLAYTKALVQYWGAHMTDQST